MAAAPTFYVVPGSTVKSLIDDRRKQVFEVAGHRRPDHRNSQCHPQPRPRDVQLSGAKWYSAPKPVLLDSLFEVDLDRPLPRNDEPAFDAANVIGREGRGLWVLERIKVDRSTNEMKTTPCRLKLTMY